MRHAPLFQLTAVKVREMLREPEALFWVFVFPILLALALGVAFRAKAPERLPVAVERGPGAEALLRALQASPELRARVLDAEAAAAELRAGRVALVVEPGDPWVYRYDPTRPDSQLARLAVDDALQRGAGRADVHAVATRAVTEPGARYIDFLVPGLLGLNLMGTGMWGIGFYVVSARTKHLLKRLVATPMRRTHFLLSQILGRLVFLGLEVTVLLAFARLIFGVPLRGSLLTLGAVTVLGAMTFAGLGLLVAARPRTIEGVSGLVNVVQLPMWILSGTFFATSRFPDALQPIIRALPLTAVNDALRAVMLEGAAWGAIGGELLVAATWCVGSFGLALALFRWR